MSLLQNSNAISEGGYPISNSLRFQSASSQSLSRTFLTPTDAKKWTFSGWIKRANLSTDQVFFGSAVSTAGYNESRLYFLANNTIRLLFQNGSSTAAELITTQVFRDPSAFYHISVVVDTNNATSSDRVILYINGVRVTAFSTATYPSLSASFNFNTAVQHALGAGYTTATQTSPNFGFTDGYMTEVNFIDGQALTPSSFGETDVLTGQWVAKKYTGTYGTNGFYLPFSNGTSTTTLGYDSSGNSNNWTLNNFTRSAGVSDCWMFDVPSGNGGVSGTQPSSNYAVMNPVTRGIPGSNGAVAITFSRGNLQVNWSTGSYCNVLGSMAIPLTGKWYWEMTVLSGISTCSAGIATSYAESAGASTVYLVFDAGAIYSDASGAVQSGLGTITTNDVLGIAWDADSSSIRFYKNGVALGTNQSYTRKANVNYYPTAGQTFQGSATSSAHNFGQRSFAYTPPTGFKALCTANLPAATIVKGNQYMDATTYTGNGSTQTITNAGGFSPDLVWIKDRSVARDHRLFDTIRGATKELYSNLTDAEFTQVNSLTAFNSNGFSVGSTTAVNGSAETFVAWQWDAGSSTVTNTNGSISSQVRANPTAGVSVVTYTGNGSAGQSVGHGLGVAPKLWIIKNRSAGTGANWITYTTVIDGTLDYLFLDLTSAAANAGESLPTSSVFYIPNTVTGNTNGNNYVAYAFTDIAGFSKIGKYTGNGSADGTFVYTGFRPKYVMIKCTNDISHWTVEDSSRNPYNVATASLYTDTSGSEITSVMSLDLLSNGFKCRNVLANESNVNGYTYIYMAFAENPMAQSNAR